MKIQRPVQRCEESWDFRGQVAGWEEKPGRKNPTVSLELSDSHGLPLGKLPELSEAQFPHKPNDDKYDHYGMDYCEEERRQSMSSVFHHTQGIIGDVRK